MAWRLAASGPRGRPGWSGGRATRAGTGLGIHRVLPVLPELSRVLPGRGLRRGSTIAVATGRSAWPAGGAVAGAGPAGRGVPDRVVVRGGRRAHASGAVAAAEVGIALDRLALVPNPGPEWPTVVAALIDGVDVVVTAVPTAISPSIASRLAARARQRGSVLVPYGPVGRRRRHAPGDRAGVGRPRPGRGRLRCRAVDRSSARGAGRRGAAEGDHLWMPWPPVHGGSGGARAPPSPGERCRTWRAIGRGPALTRRSGRRERGACDGARTADAWLVWCPDWPVIAAEIVDGVPAHDPVAVLHANRVVACSAAARAEGVRRGLRKREAQGRCPQLTVVEHDPGRDARAFEPVVAAVEEVVAGVEVVRPGACALAARGPARYFGGEEPAAERIVEHVAAGLRGGGPGRHRRRGVRRRAGRPRRPARRRRADRRSSSPSCTSTALGPAAR